MAALAQLPSTSTFAILSASSGLALTQKTQYGPITQEVWTEAANQTWRLELENGTAYRIRNVATNQVMDLDCASSANGARINGWDWGHALHQTWSVTEFSPGKFAVSSCSSGKVLDLHAGLPTAGIQLQQWEWNGGTDNQLWRIAALHDGRRVSNLRERIATGVCWSSDLGWKLVWSDEFDGCIKSEWTFEIGTGEDGWGNQELQYYRVENATVELREKTTERPWGRGMLVIQAKREDYGGCRYTSARMKTENFKRFKYGRVEARMKLPSFTGAWPAFWMLGTGAPTWPQRGEIDVVESINTQKKVVGTMHWTGPKGENASYGKHRETETTDWHVYAIEWNPEFIRWFVDGNCYHEANIKDSVNNTGAFHHEFYLLLNLAVDGKWPRAERDLNLGVDDAALPAELLVDYVRVWQRDPDSAAVEGPAFDTTKILS